MVRSGKDNQQHTTMISNYDAIGTDHSVTGIVINVEEFVGMLRTQEQLLRQRQRLRLRQVSRANREALTATIREFHGIQETVVHGEALQPFVQGGDLFGFAVGTKEVNRAKQLQVQFAVGGTGARDQLLHTTRAEAVSAQKHVWEMSRAVERRETDRAVHRPLSRHTLNLTP